MAEENTTQEQEEVVRKRKRDYHLMLFIDNEKGEIAQMGISRVFIEIVAGILLGIILITSIGWGVSGAARRRAVAENAKLSASVDELTNQVSELTTANTELENKVTILSDTVNTKVEQENALQEETEDAHLPEGFPLSSSASMKTDEDDENTVIFSCAPGSNIISAGAGTVIEVIPDADHGNCIRIDHDNGYITEYYNSSTPLVKEGNSVIEGSILYVVEDGSDKLIYKVFLDGKAIDPMSIIRIDG